jgi:hypothetical protein
MHLHTAGGYQLLLKLPAFATLRVKPVCEPGIELVFGQLRHAVVQAISPSTHGQIYQNHCNTTTFVRLEVDLPSPPRPLVFYLATVRI